MTNLSPSVFVLTASCSKSSRDVVHVTRGVGDRASRATPSSPSTVGYGPPPEVATNDGLDWDYSWSDEATVAVLGPKSYTAALPLNDAEVQRARELLKDAEGPFKDTGSAKEDVQFYREVLHHFHRWYREHGLEFPADGGGAPEAKAEVYARAAFHHLDDVDNVQALFRLVLADPEADKDETSKVRKALVRAGYYPQDPEMSPEEKYAEMARHIRAYVEGEIKPKRPRKGGG